MINTKTLAKRRRLSRNSWRRKFSPTEQLWYFLGAIQDPLTETKYQGAFLWTFNVESDDHFLDIIARNLSSADLSRTDEQRMKWQGYGLQHTTYSVLGGLPAVVLPGIRSMSVNVCC